MASAKTRKKLQLFNDQINYNLNNKCICLYSNMDAKYQKSDKCEEIQEYDDSSANIVGVYRPTVNRRLGFRVSLGRSAGAFVIF